MKKMIYSPRLQLKAAIILLYGIVFLMIYTIAHACFGSTFLIPTDISFVIGLSVLCLGKRLFFETYTPRLAIVMFVDFLFFAIFIGSFVLIQNYFGSVFVTGFIELLWLFVMDVWDTRKGYPVKAFTVKWYYIAEIIMIYMCGIYTRTAGYKKTAFFFLILLILLYFWCTYLQEMIRYFEINRHVENVPTNNIFTDNTRAFIKVIGILAIILLFATFFTFDEVFIYLGRGVLYAIAMFVSLLGKIMEFFLALFPGTGNVGISNAINDLSALISKYSWIFNLIGNLFALFLVIWILRKMRGMFRRDSDEPEKQIVKRIVGRDSTDEIETIIPKEKVRRRVAMNNAMKIRQLFKSRMEKKYRKQVPKTMTAQELVDLNYAKEKKNLASYYDEARYSEHEITDESVKNVRQMK